MCNYFGFSQIQSHISKVIAEFCDKHPTLKITVKNSNCSKLYMHCKSPIHCRVIFVVKYSLVEQLVILLQFGNAKKCFQCN